MSTEIQQRWMRLIELLNSDDFGYPCSWFEDAAGDRLPLMANRIPAAEYVPAGARRMRIDGRTWVRGDDWIGEDIQGIYNKLRENPNYLVQLCDETLYVELSPAVD